MDFKEILKGMVKRVDGGVAALIMGYDGIPLEEYKKDGVTLDIQLVGIEYSGVLKETRKASEVLEGGPVTEVSISSGIGIVLCRTLVNDYFLLLLIAPDGNLGKARYVMRLVAPQIQEQL